MPTILRPALPKDIPLLIKARLDFFYTLGCPILPDDLQKVNQQLDTFLSEHLERDLFACIVMEGEAMAAAGFLQVVRVMWHPAVPDGQYGRIINILTWPEYRHQGLARAIMQALIQKAREINLPYIDLEATPDGQPLYESLGFSLLQAKHPPMRLYLSEQ